MNPRDTKSAKLMRENQDAPASPYHKLQVYVDRETLSLIDAGWGPGMAAMTRSEWLREAIRDSLRKGRQ